MRALKIASALLCVLMAASVAFGLDVVRYENVVRNTRGDVIGGASISVYTANTTTAVTLYSTVAGTTTKANPTATDTAGRFFFYVVPGTYDVRVSGSGITTYTLEDIDLTGGAFAREATDPQLLYGDGAPTVASPVGSIYQRGDGVQDSTLYIQGPTDWYSVMMPANRAGSEYADFGDQTPDVSSTDFLIFSNHAPTSVTSFDGGVEGQILSVFISDNNTVLVAGALSNGLFMEDDLFGNGTYAVFRYGSGNNAWFLMWSSNMANVAQDYYLDNWDPYGIDATMPVLADPNFWPGWDADAPRPLYNLVSGTCSASLDSTVVLTLNVVADEPVLISTMLIAGGDTTITNYSGSYATNAQRVIQTGVACGDGDLYSVNYKIVNAGGHESPWWYGGSFTVIIEEQEFPVLAHVAGSVAIVGTCDGTADLEVFFNTDIPCDANYIWTKVGSGDTSAVDVEGTGTFHLFEIETDSTCTNGSQFAVFFSLTNEDDETGERYGPYTYTVSGLDETAPSQGVATLSGQCSATNSQVYLQLNVTAQEACYMSAQWRVGTTGTYTPVAQQTAFSPVHTLSIDTGNACVANQVYYVQYRLTDQFANTSAWFSGGSYTVTTAPPPTDTLAPVFSATGSSVAASVVNGNAVLTVTINADETFSAFCHARSGTNDIAFGVPAEDPQGNPNFGDPITRVVNTGVVAVNGQAWTVTATLFDDDYNYTNNDAVTVGTAIVNMTPTFGPEISGVTGSYDDDATIVISGSNFGVKSPAAPLVWDDFEDGTEGQLLGSPWSTPTGDITYSDDVQRVAGGMSILQDYVTAYGRALIYNLPLTLDEFYVSGWWYNDQGGAPSRNVKIINFTGVSDGSSPYDYGNANLPQSRVDVYPNTGSGHLYAENSDHEVRQDWGVDENLRPGQWQRIERYMNTGTPGTATGRTWIKRDLEYWGRLDNVEIYSAADAGSGNGYTMLLITHYFAKDTGTPTPWMRGYWDELYLDTTVARVEIGNSPSFAACTHREIQIPATWASGSISVQLNQGDFEYGETAYLFVVNENDVASPGFPIVWAGSGSGETDTTDPAIVPSTFSYTNVSWGDAGVDSLAVIVEFGVSEPSRIVGQIAPTAINGEAVSPVVYAPADTTGLFSAFTTTFSDTLFTEESWADTVDYVTRYLLEDRAGNMTSWVTAGTAGFGHHDGVVDEEPAEAENDTIYVTFGYAPAANHPIRDNTPYEAGTVEQDSLYYFLWAPRNQSGSNAATTTSAATYFGTNYEFGGYSNPMGVGGLATSDTSFVAFTGCASARRLSGLGQYIADAKFYFHMSTSDPNDYTFGPSPNFYAAAVCTNSTFFEAEAVAMGNPVGGYPDYSYVTNNISYARPGEGTWNQAPSTFVDLEDYGIGVSTQQTFTHTLTDYSAGTWYYHDFTDALKHYYGDDGPGNGHGVIIAQMGHAPGTTGPVYPDFGAWKSSTAVIRPLLLVQLVIPRTLRNPASQPIQVPPSGGKDPNIIQEP